MKSFHLLLLLVALIVGVALALRFLPTWPSFLTGEEQTGQPPLVERRVLLADGRVHIPVEVARTAEEQRRGLSYRESLPAGEGMLFAFPVAEPRSFWMYGMQFPLDMLFIRDGRIVGMRTDVQPPAETSSIPAIIRSETPVDMVLELNAGTIEAWGLVKGMEIGDDI